MTPRGYRQNINERLERQSTNVSAKGVPEPAGLVDQPFYKRELMLSSAFESMRL
jgi:hypothetical protein